MRIGILTYHFSDNYGALFQAYALKEWFLKQGCNVEFINYHPDYVEGGGFVNFKKLVSKDNLKVIYLKLTKLKEKYFGNNGHKKSFDQFRTDILGISGKEFKTLESLNYQLSDFDLLVCGSDQIWKPSEHFGVDPVYFLNFKIKNPIPRKISYAPSFGKDTLDNQYHNQVSTLVKKLDMISVREESGCKIVNELTGLIPHCVPDPTFLIEDYSSIFKSYPNKSKKHVFCYALRSRNVIGEVAENISKRLNSSLYSPHNSHRRWREIGETVFPCPQQWLYLLNTSEFVVTNSFHGTALSILLKKPFVVVGLQGRRKVFNARVENLLKSLNLESRYIQNYSDNVIDEIFETDIDWALVEQRVLSLRKSGVDYLKDELQHLRGNLDE